MSDLAYLSLTEARGLIATKAISRRELAEAVIARIGAVEGTVGAYLHLDLDRYLAEATARDAAGTPGGALDGLPVAMKDVLATNDMPTTCGSRILSGYRSPFDATAVARIRAAGALFPGKTNMDEFAMGSSTENSAYHPTKNPWDTARIPGGSSGGSAAAVAAGECLAATGTDTGGSIRQPAALCGIVGLKPTYGRISRYGLVAFASSLDQVGPMTRSVEDAALLLSVMAGEDKADATSLPAPVPDYVAACSRGVKGLRIGLPDEYFGEGIDPEVRKSVMEAVNVLEQLGASVTPVSLPHTSYSVATYYLIAPAEASSNLARFDGVKYGLRVPAETLIAMYKETRHTGFGAEVKRRIMIGTYALSAGYYDAYYRKAQQVRTLIRRDFDKVFATVDLLATPTAPTPAFRFGEKTADPLQMYLSDICTIPASLAGIPGISVPCGLVGGLPVGLQLLGRTLDEETVLAAAGAYLRETGHHLLRPEVAS
jgi:aspartyl-tRNA(Asn)/glutamyl-tRNA(Gln) amidotransferase subunit A